MRGKKNNKAFAFKEFEVNHHLCAHKVGFDGVLLGAWANVENSNSILDIGAGSGLIAMMMAQKNNAAKIFGIELDEKSAMQANENFKNCKWSERLKLIQGDFLKHDFGLAFDHIITNPPYFINAYSTPLKSRTTARHNSKEVLIDWFAKVYNLLSEKGKLSLVIPTSEKNEILSILNKNDYYLSRICEVFTKSVQFPERILLECSKTKCDVEENTLFVYDSGGNYSAEYIKLTKNYYLNF